MREFFETRRWDGAARLGGLTVPRAGVTVETPVLLPVVNPHIRTVEPATLHEAFGAEALITNGYVIYTSDQFHDRALEEGLHEMLSFPGAIATDSGSFQLAEYGDIDATTEEIVAFQREIGSDIATPVDIPTPPDASRERAERELAETTDRLHTADAMDTGEMLLNAPIQGSTYPELRERAAREAYATGLDVFPVGAVVPLLNGYRYAEVVEVVRAAKRGLGADAPVHLFGAGHPMMFALAAALGCDVFDSAAYAIYARDDRYLTVRGTEHLADLESLPCPCPVCVDHDAAELERLAENDRERLLARHNLYVSFAEMRRVREAIRRGNLLELVEVRARGHPRLVDGYRRLLADAAALERTDPASKDSFFAVSAESAGRPEVLRHHDRLERVDVPEGADVLLTQGENNSRYDDSWRVVPPFGPFPRALSETYPLSAEVPERPSRAACEAAVEGIARLAAANPTASFTLAHEGWPAESLRGLPEGVEQYRLGGEDRDGDGDGGDSGVAGGDGS
jgi:7-cyano-7-deazaguanine tRNA-ribosyltransferase